MSDTPNNDEVICPKCVHQFRAIPVSVQAELAALREELAEAKQENERLNKWADGFTDIHLRERQTGDALVKEKILRAEAAEKQLAEAKRLCLLAEDEREQYHGAAIQEKAKREQAEARALAALREHFSTKYVVGDEIYAEIDAFEKEQRNDT